MYLTCVCALYCAVRPHVRPVLSVLRVSRASAPVGLSEDPLAAAEAAVGHYAVAYAVAQGAFLHPDHGVDGLIGHGA